MKIAVLAGGDSVERDVSWSSGCKISNALADSGHRVVLVDAFLGVNLPENDPETLESLFKARPDYQDHNANIPRTPPNLVALRKNRTPDTGMYFGANVLNLCRLADVVFISLHGAAGENGQLQATFDLLNIAYTGTSYDGCVVAMDKHFTKTQIRAIGRETADWRYFPNVEAVDRDAIRNEIGYPCVVKPPRGGSSIGVSIINNEAELDEAVHKAVTADADDPARDVLIERIINGREFCVGILDGKALPPIEIIPQSGWFDYEAKYQSDRTREVCPAEIPAKLAAALQDSALDIHAALRLGFYSRIDYRVEADGAFYCLEANTLPGMTPNSLLPQEAAAAGIPYTTLCDMIVQDAVRQRLVTKGT